jgi:exonuclease III
MEINSQSKLNNQSKLKIVHWNCNSINNKQEEFKYFIYKHKPDIITLNETKINDFNGNIIFNKFKDYNFLHKQRNMQNGAGGGSNFSTKKY